MPDILTGPEEQEVMEAVVALRQSLDRIDPATNDPVLIDIREQLTLRINLLTQTIEAEVPSPKLCHCNHPDDLPALKCEFGHILGADGHGVKGPDGELLYIPLEASV